MAACRRLWLLALLVVACRETTTGPIKPPRQPGLPGLPGLPGQSSFLADIATALGVAERLSSGIEHNAAAVSLLAAQPSITLGGQSVTALAGTTFSYYPEFDSYGLDPSRGGAPPNAVRFLVYRGLVQPLQSIGYVDLAAPLGVDSLLTVRATVDNVTQADLRLAGLIYGHYDYGDDSSRWIASGSVRLDVDVAQFAESFESRSNPQSRVFESHSTFEITLPRAKVTMGDSGYFVYGEGTYNARIRVAAADSARPDSVVVDVRTNDCRRGFINDRPVEALTGNQFLVNGDTVVSDTLASFWNLVGQCVVLDRFRQAVHALLSPATFALRQLRSPSGTLRVSVTTTGPGSDPDGYVAITPESRSPGISTSRWITLAMTDAETMATLPTSTLGTGRDVILTGLGPNCVPEGSNVRNVTVPVDGFASVAFSVTCSDAPVRSGSLLYSDYGSGGHRSIRSVDANGKNRTEIAPDVDPVEFDWAFDGARIAFLRRVSGDTLEAMVFDGSATQKLGSRSGTDTEVRWSADGTRLAVTNEPGGQFHTDIFVLSADNGLGLNITQSPQGAEWSPVFSLDGSRIAFIGASSSSSWNVYAVGLDGSGLVKLTFFPGGGIEWGGALADLAWSPDGGRLLFYARRGAPHGVMSEIFAMNADGTGLVNLTQAQCGASHCYPRDSTPTWSPDGSRIVFSRVTDDYLPPQVYLMNSDGTNARPLTTDGGHAPAWSPDGSLIAFVGRAGVTITDTTGTWEMALGGTSPVRVRWRP